MITELVVGEYLQEMLLEVLQTLIELVRILKRPEVVGGLDSRVHLFKFLYLNSISCSGSGSLQRRTSF